MFKQAEDHKLIFKLTHSEIQGFPDNAQNKSIREIIQEIKQEDLLRDINRQKAKLQESKTSSQFDGRPPRYFDSGHKTGKIDTGVSIATVNLSSTSLHK